MYYKMVKICFYEAKYIRHLQHLCIWSPLISSISDRIECHPCQCSVHIILKSVTLYALKLKTIERNAHLFIQTLRKLHKVQEKLIRVVI